VRGFLVSRYGDFILLQPPFKAETLLLWLCAPVTLLIGGYFVVRASRRTRAETPRLNPEEEAQLAKIERADKAG
jgi:cytochrome c-type biogenesis protein CcmH